ncbi:hypothetical protein Vadar_008515 [Vaccinium darrowii]|uniref:Uncharacterized protein n=1 Tax=Vaccinium darrowii TaxID=229202 RepID=A0ACB7YKL0_9ERIC|nr:hypothetical protein Vadar_008515 [Vaccinium darrowii]
MAAFEIETCRGVDEGSSSTSSPAATTTNGMLEVNIDAPTEPEPYPKCRMEKAPLIDEGCSSTSAPAATTTNSTLEVRVDPRTEPKPPKRRIERVPLTMRRDERTKGYFDPRVVSIGSYHHGKEELQMAERIKPIVAELFISGSGKDMDEFRKNVMGIVDEARSCYLEGSTNKYPDMEFAEMMLLDCLLVAAVIETKPGYVNRIIQYELITHLGPHDTLLLQNDILCLLENQISFQVLELLMSLKSKHHKLTAMLDKMLHSIYSQESTRQDKRIDDTKQPIHLLEYVWLWQNKLSQSNRTPETSTRPIWDYYYSFKSVADLKAKGIYARRGSDPSQRDFKLKSFFFFAVLEIPPIILNPHYVKYISNHVAYEWMPNNPTNLPTMAYINFMKSLINTAEDVKELRARDILFTPCMSDEEAVQMFNIPTILVEDFSIYDEVKQRIQRHYNNKAKTWSAELIHNYFSSPWTFIAFAVAATLIILSFLHTFFTIFPRK